MTLRQVDTRQSQSVVVLEMMLSNIDNLYGLSTLAVCDDSI